MSGAGYEGDGKERKDSDVIFIIIILVAIILINAFVYSLLI